MKTVREIITAAIAAKAGATPEEIATAVLAGLEDADDSLRESRLNGVLQGDYRVCDGYCDAD